jgi:type IV secretory pathway TraG/TraD family ATPase VirD4
MNQVADTIRLLRTDGNRWTAREWVKNRQGWIFLTSTPETREALRPLDSLWLDLLILRLLHQANEPNLKRVWMVLDEISTLHRLPQLETALTQNRKANASILLGLQGKAQLETIYGHMAETMLSMPWTALFFKTTEPEAAEWVSHYLGMQEVERWRETKTTESSWGNRRETKTGGPERFNRFPVLASQISGLEERKGYLKSGNFIVPLTVKYLSFPEIAEGFIPRKLPEMFPVQMNRKQEPERERSQQIEQKQQPGHGRRFFE